MKIGTVFSGFGGVDIGAKAAGLTLAWGIECAPDIADVARRNLGDHVVTADILDVDPSTLEPVDVLHASPPCPNFSVAKKGATETELDLALARKVADFIEVLRPNFFTLENVYAYRKSQSWSIIRERLYGCGYWFDLAHVNAADFGVPQTRKRMIVRAVRGGFVPYLPQPERWVGWHEAIEDLIPSLPNSKLANWQMERMPDDLRSVLVEGENYNNGGIVDTERPSFTLSASAKSTHRAVLVGNALNVQCDVGDEPCSTIVANHRENNRRAILIGNNSNITSGAPIAVERNQPAQTVRTVSGGRLQRGILINEAVPQVRVVAITPRCLARFQSFPDWYKLPDGRTLAAKGIGNAVPPLLYQKIIEQLVETVGGDA